MHKTLAIAFCIVLLFLGGNKAPGAAMTVAGSIAEMNTLPRSGAVEILSYYSGLNRGGGIFYWDAGSTAKPDDCTIFAPDGGTGRWRRQDQGAALDVTMCGAYWDSVHDDAAALSHAFQIAAGLHKELRLPGGTGKVCTSVAAARGVTVRGQGMGTGGAIDQSPTLVDASCMKAGWVFDLVTPKGVDQFEAPKYYDFSIKATRGNAAGGCIRWNNSANGFTDNTSSQYYVQHPHAERIYCELQGAQQIGIECSKCFDGDLSQNFVTFGKTSIDLEGSDVMCLGCAGPNRFAYANDSLIRLVAHGTFGNMDRVVGNEILYPTDNGQSYDSFVYDASHSSTIEANHIEGIATGGKSAIHLVGGFSHAIVDNDIDVVAALNRPLPHWLVADGPFVNVRVFNNGCGGCILGPAQFDGKAAAPFYNDGGVRQVITHGGNAANGDSGFP